MAPGWCVAGGALGARAANVFQKIFHPRLSPVIAHDLPGFGESDVLASASFAAFGEEPSEVLHGLKVGPRDIYLHDFGAPVEFTSRCRRRSWSLG